MANDQHAAQGRRPHYRGRRNNDRRNLERRTPQASQEPARDGLDVEQIMRDIRTRISKAHGVDLTDVQIRELAARRLDAILEPRHVKPALLEHMRRAAAEPVEVPLTPAEPVRALDEASLYESHNGFVRFMRRLLHPILKLLFNPAPLARAMGAQARHNADIATRQAELQASQAEWNALHYEILQRVVLEVSRASLEMQSLGMRIEALAAKVDFNERRVRSLENPAAQGRPGPRAVETITLEPAAPARDGMPAPAGDAAAEGTRRRRRRRRGRRSGAGAADGTGSGTEPLSGTEADALEDAEGDEGNGDTGPSSDVAEAEPSSGATERSAAEPPGISPEHQDPGATSLEPVHAISLLQPIERQPELPVPFTPEPREPAPSAVVMDPNAVEGAASDAHRDATEPAVPEEDGSIRHARGAEPTREP